MLNYQLYILFNYISQSDILYLSRPYSVLGIGLDAVQMVEE